MSNDWAVFHRYAARVRELAYHEYWDVRLPYYIRSSVFETLLVFRRPVAEAAAPDVQLRRRRAAWGSGASPRSSVEDRRRSWSRPLYRQN